MAHVYARGFDLVRLSVSARPWMNVEEQLMRLGGKLARGLAVGGAALGLVAISAAAMPFVQSWWKPASEPAPTATQATPSPGEDPAKLTLTPEAVRAMGVQVAEAEAAKDQ